MSTDEPDDDPFPKSRGLVSKKASKLTKSTASRVAFADPLDDFLQPDDSSTFASGKAAVAPRNTGFSSSGSTRQAAPPAGSKTTTPAAKHSDVSPFTDLTLLDSEDEFLKDLAPPSLKRSTSKTLTTLPSFENPVVEPLRSSVGTAPSNSSGKGFGGAHNVLGVYTLGRSEINCLNGIANWTAATMSGTLTLVSHLCCRLSIAQEDMFI